ncbi:MAG: phosphotransferase [Deltaproteobacteria bacterium]|nr:phosphotransferase [Deltaproteobacteria bacterium]
MTGIYHIQGSPSQRAYLEQELLELADVSTSELEPTAIVELAPQDTVRTFHIGNRVVRTDMNADGLCLRAEAVALVTLKNALLEDPATPEVVLADLRRVLGEDRPVLVYPWVEGHTLHEANVTSHLDEVAELLAKMHSAPVMDLQERFPVVQPWPLLSSYKETSDALRAWTHLREQEGIGADLLTLTLSDLQRNLRSYVLAQDRLFLVRRHPVLCHGRVSVESFVSTEEGLSLVNFDKACLGDPATDLARFSIDAALNYDDELQFLHAYLNARRELLFEDSLFIPRYFARKTLLFLQVPAERIQRMMGIKTGVVQVLDDPVVTLERELSLATAELTRGLNGLLPLSGNRRLLSRREVEGMGRILGFEDLLLAGRNFHVSITGQSYSGKTEIGAALALRLEHAFFNTTGLARALAFLERAFAVERDAMLDAIPNQETDAKEELRKKKPSLRALVRRLFARGFRMEAQREAPFYSAYLNEKDITGQLRDDTDRIRAAALLDDEQVRRFLRDALTEHLAGSGLVIEGSFSQSLLPAGAKEFYLRCDGSVRRARLRNHRQDVDSDDDADVMLARLDEAEKRESHSSVVDAEGKPASAVALLLLQHLLPAARRKKAASSDFSGRKVL